MQKDNSSLHPLEFLAQAAVSNNDMTSSRNDGLIIHDHRKYQDEGQFAILSESAQNLVDNINCAKVTAKPPIGCRRRTMKHQRGGTMVMGH